MKFAAWTALVIGAMMLVQWLFFIIAGRVPEFVTEPYGVASHLAAEVATAITLLVSGTLLLRGRRRAARLALVAFGMLIYASVNSPGYFAQLGEWLLVAMFALVLVVSLAAVVRLFALPAEA